MVAVASLLGVWVWTLVVCFGLGVGVRRCFVRESLELRDAPLCVWSGYALLLCALQFWQISAPIQGTAFWTLSVLGLAAWGLGWRDGLAESWRVGAKRTAFLAAFALVLGVFLALRARGPDTHYDTGLYFLQSMRWAESYALMPGLANLDPRLGFNSSHFLYAAWVDACPWTLSAEQTANGVWIWLLLMHLVLNTAFLSAKETPTRAFSALLLPPVFYLLGFGNGLNSPSPDLVVFVLQVVLAELLLRSFEEDTRKRSLFHCASMLLLAAVGVTVKLSFGVYGLVATGFALFWLWKRKKEADAALPALGSVALASAIVGAWIYRGLVLSGYPLFPATVLGMDLEWAVPAESVRDFAEVIRAYGRQPGAAWEVLQDGAWFRPWMMRVWSDHKFLIVLPLAGAFVSLAMARFTRLGGSSKAPWFLLPAALSAGFWFGMAPEPRFAGAVFLILGAGSTVFAMGLWFVLVPVRFWLGGAGLGMLAFVVLVLAKGQPLIFPAGDERGFHPHQRAEVKVVKTESGLGVYVPESGDRVWDAPLPAAPRLNPRLRLREKGNFSAGFSVRE